MSTTAAKGDSNNGLSLKKMDGNGDRVVNDELFIDERKPSSMTAVKGNLHNGEHTLIPVTVKMIHSARSRLFHLSHHTCDGLSGKAWI